MFAFSPAGQRLPTASADLDLSVWDAAAVARGNAILKNGTVFAISRKSDRIFAVNNSAREASVVDVATKTIRATTSLSENSSAVDVTENGETFATGDFTSAVELIGSNGAFSP